jgi:hypothetical protein
MPKLHGEAHPCSKLTDDSVREIRDTYSPGVVSQTSLAQTYGVSQQMIARVLAGDAWKHILPSDGLQSVGVG